MIIAYPMHFEPNEAGGYLAQGVAPLENVVTEGATLGEARRMAAEALTGVLEMMLELGQVVPRPFAREGQNVSLISPEPALCQALARQWALEDGEA